MSQSFTQSMPVPVPVSKGGTGVVTSTGTGSVVLSNSPTFDDSIGFGDTTKGIIGTATNNDADTGYVGEIVSSVISNASAVSINTNTSTNLTSISLTAGDWDVWGNIYLQTTITTTQVTAWVSSTSATAPDQSLRNGIALGGAAAMTIGAIDAPMLRFSLSATTTIYLTGFTLFASGTSNMRGGIYARRVR